MELRINPDTQVPGLMQGCRNVTAYSASTGNLSYSLRWHHTSSHLFHHGLSLWKSIIATSPAFHLLSFISNHAKPRPTHAHHSERQPRMCPSLERKTHSPIIIHLVYGDCDIHRWPQRHHIFHARRRDCPSQPQI